MTVRFGSLELEPVREDLLAQPVAAALKAAPGVAAQAHAVAIDPDLAETATLAEQFGLDPEMSANCVIVLGKRGGELRPAACVVLASTRADVNGLVRRTT